MEDPPSRRTIAAIAVAVVVVTILLIAGFSGGHNPQILSTVGAAINNSGTRGGAEPEPTVAPTPGPKVASAAGGAALIPTLLIVRTGTLEMDVADLGASVSAADAAVGRAGGYISGSNRTADGRDEVARVTYRIPSAAWDATLDGLHRLAVRIRAENISTEEVTGKVVDLTARIANLRATEAALQAIMAKATRISDVLDVQEQLTSTRGDIEQLVGEKSHLEDQASFGSLEVTFRLPAAPVPTATPIPTKGWDPGADIANATGKLVRIGQTSTSIGIWLTIVGLPLLVALLVIVFIGWQVVRLTRWFVARRLPATDSA
jgi:Domain of unknown function (DUF4349)